MRDNILFGLPYDKERYDRAVSASALLTDFQMFHNGDAMEIGERGINISGGQKQRIAFARAIYADADVYLLDSPLSAVDQLTCTHMFEEGLKKVLKGKTIILITHQLELLKRCDAVCIMRDCAIAYLGPYTPSLMEEHFPDLSSSSLGKEKPSKLKDREEALETAFYAGDSLDSNASDVAVHYSDVDVEQEKSEVSPPPPTTPRTSQIDSPPQVGREVRSPFVRYLHRGGYFLWGVIFSIFALTQILRFATDQFVRSWVEDTYGLTSTWYLGIYGILTAVFGFLLVIRGLSFYRLALSAATFMHNRLFEKIIAAPISFFTLTPLGPLLNCFSKDQGTQSITLTSFANIPLMLFCLQTQWIRTFQMPCICFSSMPPFFVLPSPLCACKFLCIQLASPSSWPSSSSSNGSLLLRSRLSRP